MEINDLVYRLVVYFVAFAIVFFCSSDTVLVLFIYMGQAHSILAYWYKFERINSLTRTPFFWLWLFSICAFLALAASHVVLYKFWLIFTALLFVAHFIVDEITLSGRKLSFSMIPLFIGPIVLFSLQIWQFISKHILNQEVLIMYAVLTFFCTMLTVWFPKVENKKDFFSVYALILAGISSSVILLSGSVSIGHALGFIVLSHYFIWYFFYFFKLKKFQVGLQTYLVRVIVLNAAMFAIWFLTSRGFMIPFHKYFFSEVFFYIWTCIHIIFSFIPKDISFTILKRHYRVSGQ